MRVSRWSRTPTRCAVRGTPSQAGVDGLEHFTCITESGIATPSDLLDAVAAAGIVIDPTMGADASQLDPATMPPPLVELMERFGLMPDTFLDTRREQLRRAHEHGVRVVSGTDAGIGPAKRHGNAWRAVLDLATAYPAEHALAAATSYAAQVLGLDGVTGRLRPGHSADLLVVDGDVRADVTALSRPVAVLVRGEPPRTGRDL